MGLDSALKDRLEEMIDKVWMSLGKRTCAMIRAYLVDEIFYDVGGEDTQRFMVEVTLVIHGKKHVQ